MGESYDGVVQRVEAAVRGGFDRWLAERNLILVRGVYALNRADGLAGMADEIEALDARPAVVAVDTFNLALDGNEDSAEDIKRAVQGLRALVSRYGGTGLLIDHMGHGDKTRPRGSSAKKPTADVMVMCERDPATRYVALTQTKNRDADKENYRAAFQGETVHLDDEVTDLHFRAVELRTRTSERSATRIEFERETQVPYILAAMRSVLARRWQFRTLAAEARRLGCEIDFDYLRKHVLKPGGWAPKHPALAPYYDYPTQSWVTPAALPPIDRQYVLNEEDIQ